MESYWYMNEYGKARHQDLLRQAEDARRFLSSKKLYRLPALVKSLMLIFG